MSRIISKSTLVILGVDIKVDSTGRYCLNDLHRASGGEKRHGPSYWLSNLETQELIAAIIEDMVDAGIPVTEENQPVVSTKGGYQQGTYVCEDLVYAYAMWINAKFHLQVIRGFRAYVEGSHEEKIRQESREKARMESPFMNKAVIHNKKSEGKEVQFYHFSNEYDMINRIVLGMTAKDYRNERGIKRNEAIRDKMEKDLIVAIEHLQRLNTSLLEIKMGFQERKDKLIEVYLERYAQQNLLDSANYLE